MANTSSTTPQNVGEATVVTTAKPTACDRQCASSTGHASSRSKTSARDLFRHCADGEPEDHRQKRKLLPQRQQQNWRRSLTAKAASSTGGSYQVQLGAFKSESEAQAAWKKISGAHKGRCVERLAEYRPGGGEWHDLFPPAYRQLREQRRCESDLRQARRCLHAREVMIKSFDLRRCVARSCLQEEKDFLAKEQLLRRDFICAQRTKPRAGEKAGQPRSNRC